MKTTKGHEVMGLQPAFDTQTYAFTLQSGRVRLVKDNPHYDQHLKWSSSGKAHNHDFGDLILSKGDKG